MVMTPDKFKERFPQYKSLTENELANVMINEYRTNPLYMRQTDIEIELNEDKYFKNDDYE